jgi:hypothetical protein
MIMNFFEDEMLPRDHKTNAKAAFLPAVSAEDNDGTYAPPCIEIGGVQVYVYVRDGILVISGHFDTADTSCFAAYGPDGTIPVFVKMGDCEHIWEALPDTRPGTGQPVTDRTPALGDY